MLLAWIALLTASVPNVSASTGGPAPSLSTEAQARRLVADLVSAVQGRTRPRGGSKFNVSGCPRIPPQKWAGLLMREPIVHDFKFAPGCDIQGKLKITLEPFPVDLEVRNLPEVRRARSIMQVRLDPRVLDQEADLDVDATQGQAMDARGSEVLAFDSTYGVTLGLDGKLKENRGGRATLKRFRGSEVKLTEPIRVR